MKSMSKPLSSIVIAAAFVVWSAGFAAASPCVTGATGLVLNPTADVATVGVTEGIATFYSQDGAGSANGGFDTLNLFGVSGLSPRSEFSVGYTRISADQGTSKDGFGGGYKFQLVPSSLTTPAVAVGINYMNKVGTTVTAGDVNSWTFYGAVTKDISPEAQTGLKVRGTLGVRWDQFDFGGAVGNSSDVTVYGGGQAFLNPKLSLIAEIGSRHKAFAKRPFSAVLRYEATDTMNLQAGVLNAGYAKNAGFIVSLNFAWSGAGWK